MTKNHFDVNEGSKAAEESFVDGIVMQKWHASGFRNEMAFLLVIIHNEAPSKLFSDSVGDGIKRAFARQAKPSCKSFSVLSHGDEEIKFRFEIFLSFSFLARYLWRQCGP